MSDFRPGVTSKLPGVVQEHPPSQKYELILGIALKRLKKIKTFGGGINQGYLNSGEGI